MDKRVTSPNWVPSPPCKQALRMPFAAAFYNSKTICQTISHPSRFSIQVHGKVGKGPSVSRSHVFPPLPRLKGKVPWENLYAPHYPVWCEHGLS